MSCVRCANGEHVFSRVVGWNSARSSGNVSVRQCTDCLAIRIVQRALFQDGYIETVTVVDPKEDNPFVEYGDED